MPEQTEFVNLSELDANAEEIESKDYLDYDLLQPGLYLSKGRMINGRKKDDGTTTFEVSFIGGLENPETGEVVANGGFPLRHYISTKLFVQKNRPGKTSSVAQYLRAAGIDPKDVTPLEGLTESQTIPVVVSIGWEEKIERNPDGSYAKTQLKTKDFNQGTKDAPVYVPVVLWGSQTYTARHKVNGFRKVA